MDDNKKYDIVGKVEIGTDEYRDLIESAINNEKEASEYRSKFWNEQNKVNTLEKQLDEYKDRWATLCDFMSEHSAVKDDWMLYLVKHKVSNEYEEE